MKKFLQKKLKDQKGMTLIELLAVIVILAIIAAIAIPAIGNIIENSRHKAAVSDTQMILSAANLYFTEKGIADETSVTLAFTDGAVSGDLEPYIDDHGNVTAATITKKATGNEITATVTLDKGAYTFTELTNNELSNLTNTQIKDAYEATK